MAKKNKTRSQRQQPTSVTSTPRPTTTRSTQLSRTIQQPRRLPVVPLVVGLLVLAVTAALVATLVNNQPSNTTAQVAVVSGTPTSTPEPLQVRPAVDEGSTKHVEAGQRVQYKATAQNLPPASGDHYARWEEWKYFEQPVQPELFVHNLEHGGIVVLYNCPNGCPVELRMLQDAYKFLPRSKTFGTVKLLVSPYPGLQKRFALLAWNQIALHETIDVAMLQDFYNRFIDRGPELAP